MKTSTNLSHSAAGDRRNAGKHLIEAMRMVGMTDAEIRAELEKMVAARSAPTAVPDNEPDHGQSQGTAASGSAGGAS